MVNGMAGGSRANRRIASGTYSARLNGGNGSSSLAVPVIVVEDVVVLMVVFQDLE